MLFLQLSCDFYEKAQNFFKKINVFLTNSTQKALHRPCASLNNTTWTWRVSLAISFQFYLLFAQWKERSLTLSHEASHRQWQQKFAIDTNSFIYVIMAQSTCRESMRAQVSHLWRQNVQIITFFPTSSAFVSSDNFSVSLHC